MVVPVFRAGFSRVPHPFATFHPEQAPGFTFDLHVLSAPPAFVLSQDQTLRLSPERPKSPGSRHLYWPQANLPPTTTQAKAQATTSRRPTRVFQKMHKRHKRRLHIPPSSIPTCQKNMCQQPSAETPGFPDDGLAATNRDIAPVLPDRKPLFAKLSAA